MQCAAAAGDEWKSRRIGVEARARRAVPCRAARRAVRPACRVAVGDHESRHGELLRIACRQHAFSQSTAAVGNSLKSRWTNRRSGSHARRRTTVLRRQIAFIHNITSVAGIADRLDAAFCV